MSRIATLAVYSLWGATIALDIKAEVMRWVYSVGSEKPLPVTSKPAKSQGGGFFSSLFGLGSSTPQRVATPQPVTPAPDVDLTEINESSVRLSIFAANVDVRLDKKMTAELLRSTKKNPPSKVKFELIYVSPVAQTSQLKTL